MSELPVYETWLERNGHVEDVVTDAPGGMRLIDADDYDKLQAERDQLAEDRRDLMEALMPLKEIADRYDNSGLDEHRPEWGDRDHEKIELFSGRGGKELLTLADAFRARTAIDKIKAREVEG